MTDHKSDCAVHNEPAMKAGPCDCGADESDVLEAMAAALFVAYYWPAALLWSSQPDQTKELWRKLARAALTAALDRMQSPSEQAKLVGARSIGQTMDFPNHTERSRDCWQAMLDQLRKEALP